MLILNRFETFYDYIRRKIQLPTFYPNSILIAIPQTSRQLLPSVVCTRIQYPATLGDACLRNRLSHQQ